MINPERQSIRQLAALTCLVVIGGFLVYTLSSFLTAFLSAIILYILLKPVMRLLCVRWKWKPVLAVVALMLLSFITILLPVAGLSYMLSTKVNYVINHSDEFIKGLYSADAYIKTHTGFALLSEDSMIKIKDSAANLIPQFLSKTLDTVGTIGILYFILFFLLRHYGIVEEKMAEYLPFNEENAHLFITELESMVYSSVLGAPLLAIIQGLFAGLGFWIFGVPEPLFWGTICGFFSFLPVVGTALVWIPAGILQYAAGYHWQGIAILLFGGLIITNIDNVFRFVLQKKIADVHPVVTLLGVIMGIDLLGLPGIVFGPLFISWFLLLVKIYKNEFSDKPKIVISSSSQTIQEMKDEIIKQEIKKE